MQCENSKGLVNKSWHRKQVQRKISSFVSRLVGDEDLNVREMYEIFQVQHHCKIHYKKFEHIVSIKLSGSGFKKKKGIRVGIIWIKE